MAKPSVNEVGMWSCQQYMTSHKQWVEGEQVVEDNTVTVNKAMLSFHSYSFTMCLKKQNSGKWLTIIIIFFWLDGFR